MSGVLDQSIRSAFVALADVLIPAYDNMPAASTVDVGGETLDRILSLRDDLTESLVRGLSTTIGKDPEAAARELNESDPKALATIGLVASAAYYMNPTVRNLIGYPGQERRPIAPDSTPEFMKDGLLEPVIKRGPIYKPTPKPAA